MRFPPGFALWEKALSLLLTAIVWTMIILVAVLTVAAVATSAHAQEKNPASINTKPYAADQASSWKFGPSVAAAVVAIDVRSGDYYAGANAIPLGACLGATYLPWSLGADGCFNIQVSNAEKNRYFPSLMVHWRDWVNAGAGLLYTQNTGWKPLLLLGGRLGLLGG